MAIAARFFASKGRGDAPSPAFSLPSASSALDAELNRDTMRPERSYWSPSRAPRAQTFARTSTASDINKTSRDLGRASSVDVMPSEPDAADEPDVFTTHAARHVVLSKRHWDIYTRAPLRRTRPLQRMGGTRYTGSDWAPTKDEQSNIYPTFFEPVHLKGAPSLATTSSLNSRRYREQVKAGQGCCSASERSIFGLPMISPFSRLALAWSWTMLMVDACYIAFFMPLSSAFCPLLPGSLTWCSGVDLVSGIIFFLNLITCFHVGYIFTHSYKNTLMMDGRVVAQYYTRHGGLIVDAISVVPFFYQVILLLMHNHDFWLNRAISFIQIVRLVRLGYLLRAMYVDTFKRSAPSWLPYSGIYGLTMGYTVAVLINMLACLTWLVAELEGLQHSWVASVKLTDLVNAPPSAQYFVSVYWVMTTVTNTGYGDIVPTSLAEVAVAMLCQIVGVSLFALLVGSMAELLTQATRQARQAHAFREKMQEVNDWLDKKKLPKKIQRQIHGYYAEVWLQHRSHPGEAQLFRELPNFLRAKVASCLSRDVVRAIAVFDRLDDTLVEHIAARLWPVEIAPGHDLCREGDEGDCLWLLQEGDMLALHHTEEVEYLRAPCLLGEGLLLADEMSTCRFRPCTYRAVQPCHLWQLKMRDLKPLFAYRPALQEHLLENLRRGMLTRLSGGGNRYHHAHFSELLLHLNAKSRPGMPTQQEVQEEISKARCVDGSLQRVLSGLARDSLSATWAQSRAKGSVGEGLDTLPEEGYLERPRAPESDTSDTPFAVDQVPVDPPRKGPGNSPAVPTQQQHADVQSTVRGKGHLGDDREGSGHGGRRGGGSGGGLGGAGSSDLADQDRGLQSLLDRASSSRGAVPPELPPVSYAPPVVPSVSYAPPELPPVSYVPEMRSPTDMAHAMAFGGGAGAGGDAVTPPLFTRMPSRVDTVQPIVYQPAAAVSAGQTSHIGEHQPQRCETQQTTQAAALSASGGGKPQGSHVKHGAEAWAIDMM